MLNNLNKRDDIITIITPRTKKQGEFIKRNYTKIGDKDSEGFTTILIYPLTYENFTLYHLDSENKTDISYDKSEAGLEIKLNGIKLPHVLNIHSPKEPKYIELDGEQLNKVDSWNYNTEKQKLVIKTKNYENGNYDIKY